MSGPSWRIKDNGPYPIRGNDVIRNMWRAKRGEVRRRHWKSLWLRKRWMSA